MNLKHIRYILLFFLFPCVYADIWDTPELSIKELKSNGAAFIKRDVSIRGFLFVDDGMFVYPDMSSFLNSDVNSAVFLEFNDYQKYKSFSGCFVNVVGSVSTHKTDKNLYRIKKLKHIIRTGPLYLMALDKKMGRDGNIKCELEAIVDAM